jgi:hypothetical protein
LVEKEVATIKDLRTILKSYEAQQKVSSLKTMAEKKLFVTSAKDFMTLLGMMAQTVHHASYKIALEYTRVGYHVAGWSQKFEDPADDLLKETLENSNLVAKTLLSAVTITQKSDWLFKLPILHMQILAYLYPLKHTFTPIPVLQNYFAAVHKTKVTTAVKNLVNTQHLQISVLAKDRQYVLTALGVRTVHQWMEAVLTAIHFR